jgi:hypothetical protein
MARLLTHERLLLVLIVSYFAVCMGLLLYPHYAAALSGHGVFRRALHSLGAQWTGPVDCRGAGGCPDAGARSSRSHARVALAQALERGAPSRTLQELNTLLSDLRSAIAECVEYLRDAVH